MGRFWLKGMRRYLAWTCAVLVATAGGSQAGDNEAEMRAKLEEQGRQIQELKRIVEQGVRPAADAKDAGNLNEGQVKKIVEGYLKDNPGAGMPNGVQTGYSSSTGFTIKSTNDPTFVKYDDESKIPFELRIRGRIQIDYYNYKVTDTTNHLTGRPTNPANVFNPSGGAAQTATPVANVGANSQADFSQLEAKRARIYFEGTAFDPNLRYGLVFDGNTRGISGLANGNGETNFGGTTIQGGNTIATVDHAVRLFSAYVAYDFHPCWSNKGCSPDCPEGSYKYAPTYSAIAGKIKPFFGLEEYLGSGTEQFVEYSMANWFFDADDDNYLMAAGLQVKEFDDRLFFSALVTNGNETQIANLQMDSKPGINVGGWYDFGGTWNEGKKKWDLFGDSLSDIDWSQNLVIRTGAAANLVPMDRRSQFTNAELNRVRVTPGAPGGTTILGMLNGGSAANVGNSLDAVDEYTFNSFIAAKWHGFSLYNEWWLRDLNNFRGAQNTTGASNPVFYTFNTGSGGGNFTPSKTGLALFTAHSVIDYGTAVQGGYFIVPKKFEIVGRWSWIRGQSGNINGNNNSGTALLTTTKANQIPGVPAGVTIVKGAFSNYEEVNEYAVGFNYYFRRQQLKFSTDLSFYNGGNPAANGQSAAGFIPGVDGYMLRSQIQINF